MRLAPSRLAILALAALAPAPAESRAGYQVTNLVSDIPGLAANTDPSLKNPWGVSYSPTGPFWVSNQATSLSTLYNGSGVPSALKVSTPTVAGGPNGPTGQVWNGNAADFRLSNGTAASFLFADLNGQISGWNGGLGATGTVPAQVVVSGTGSLYTGLAIGQVGTRNVLYAADARGGKIDVFDATFAGLNATTFAGKFADAGLATAGFRPYNVQAIGSNVYVTYNSRANGGDPATSGGAVAVFDLNGNLIADFSNGAVGPLQDPWGIALAPSGFGEFGGALLVGNKFSGRINAFNATTGAFLGLVATVTNDPTGANNGLWALSFGNGRNAGPADTLYAFAGINDERNGLMVSITSVPEPGSLALMAVGGLLSLAVARRRARARR